jgi:hypothetical protein
MNIKAFKINLRLWKTQIGNKNVLRLEIRKSLNLNQSNLQLSYKSENTGILGIEF